MVLVKDMGHSQKQVSKMLGTSEAAVSNYLKGKRGKKRIDPKVDKKIKNSAKRIVSGAEINKEICDLCKYWMKAKNKKIYC